MAEYEVVEKFVSINGEGKRAGELAVFIRLKGCNLQCCYCDTKWANTSDASAVSMTEEDIASYIKETGVKNVTLTGGEPLYREHMSVLITRLLQEPNIRVEIETNGSVNLNEFAKLDPRPSFTMDYKLGSSGMENKMCTDNFFILEKEDTVKFVVGSRKDLERAAEIISEQNLLERVSVYFSPVFGKIDPQDMVAFMMERKLNDVKLQLQLHKFIWDPNQTGV